MKKSVIISFILAAAISLVAYAEVVVTPKAGYETIQHDGVALPKSRILNIAGGAANCDGTVSKTTCTITGGAGGGQVDEVVAGANVTVDSSDPTRPIVSATASGETTTTLPWSAITGTPVIPEAHSQLTGTGTNTHVQIDSHLSGTTSEHGGIVSGSDSRLTDARTPLAHSQAFSTITGSASLDQVTDLQYMHDSEQYRFCSGLVSGGSITLVSGGSFTISAGLGFINDHTGAAGSYKKITWNDIGGVATVGDGTNHICVDGNGNVNVSLTKQAMASHVYLGHVYVIGGNIIETFNVPEWTGHYQGRMNEFIAHAIGTLIPDGNIVTEQATALKLSISSGEMYARLGEFATSATTTFTKIYNNGPSWTVDGSSPNYVNVTQYNNVASGLVTMTAGYWKKDLVLRVPNGNAYYIYGQNEYTSEVYALAGPLPAIPADISTDAGMLAVIVLQKNDATIGPRIKDIRPNLDRVFGFGTSSSGSTVDHGTLGGLDHDDHTQYLTNLRGDARYPSYEQLLNELNVNHAPLTTGVHGAGVNSFVYSNDSRLTDARTPTAHNQDATTITTGVFDPNRLASGSGLQVARRNAGNTALEFVTLAGGGDMLGANNLSDVVNITTARSNLGLFSMATKTAADYSTTSEANALYTTPSAVSSQLTTSINAKIGTITTGKWCSEGETGKITCTQNAPAASGDVVGPASAVSANIATYDGPTGKIITDSGAALSTFQAASKKDAGDGYAGLTGYSINFKNAANTYTSTMGNTNTAARTYTFVDRNAEVGNNINNYSTASQAPAASTRTYIAGSQIAIPAGKLRIGTILRWTIHITKNAAGTAASNYDIAFGTAGTTADTARVSFTKPAGTAVADTGKIIITAIVRGPLSASGIVNGMFDMAHNLASTGHAAIPNVEVNTTSAAFDVTTPTYVGICITSGASDAITIQQVIAESVNL